MSKVLKGAGSEYVCGKVLKVLSLVGHILEDVIEQRDSTNDKTASDEITKTLCGALKRHCQTANIKMAIQALQSISKGEKYCRNFAQPIVGQISNQATTKVQEVRIQSCKRKPLRNKLTRKFTEKCLGNAKRDL